MIFETYIPRLKSYTVQPQNSKVTSTSVAQLILPKADSRLFARASACFAKGTVQQVPSSDTTTFALQVGGGAIPSFALAGRADAYTLAIGTDTLLLQAETARGLFYGMQLLADLLAEGDLPCCEVSDWADVALRAEYLDLRAFCPIFEHVLRDIKRMSWCHSNAVVIEYEDKLPFVHMPELRNADHCYTTKQIEQLGHIAWENFVDVIPLQQSFGHLEYVLKKPEYRHLRECEEQLGEMNPLHPESIQISRTLLQDVMAFHPHAPYIHIGCDEVWSLGMGEQSRASGHSRARLFIDYINQLVDEVCAHGKTPIMWHDMLFEMDGSLSCTQEELDLLDRRVVLAIWLYNGNTIAHQVSRITNQLDTAGIAYLGAGAVRCWDLTPVQQYPVAIERVRNITQWAQLAIKQPLPGVIMTNWVIPFTLGSPYSIYETAIYLSSYAAEQLWNSNQPQNDFLQRFFAQYHGVQGLSLADMGYQPEDYYPLAGQYLSQATKNTDVLQLVACMFAYKNIKPFAQNIFRASLYPDCVEEKESLATHAARHFVQMQDIRPAVEQVANAFLPPHMAEAFVASRFEAVTREQRDVAQLVGEQRLAQAVEKQRKG